MSAYSHLPFHKGLDDVYLFFVWLYLASFKSDYIRLADAHLLSKFNDGDTLFFADAFYEFCVARDHLATSIIFLNLEQSSQAG